MNINIDHGFDETSSTMAESIGKVFGVGVGPGDPELITRKAVRVLTEVDWIFMPACSRSGASLARRIVEPLGLPEAKFRPIGLGMSTERAADISAYANVAAEMAQEARRGRSVAWITEGDPLLYSTFVYILEELGRYPEIEVEVVPGVTSASAAAARCCVPIACLDERAAIVPARYGIGRLPALLDEFATVLLFKVNSVFDQLLAAMEQSPRRIRAVYVERVGAAAERVVTDLQSLRGQELPYWALVILRREERS
jgi:precorrin-2/cobalt-factor-2 C20-methyltransferase